LPNGAGWSACDCGASAPADGGTDAPQLHGDAAAEGSVPGSDAPSAGDSPAPTGNCAAGEDPQIDLDHNGVADCAETLVQNSQFVSTADHWITAAPATEVTYQWNANDARGSGASGSLQVTNSILSADLRSSTLGVDQCVPVTAGTTYVIAGQFFIPTGQKDAGADVIVFFYSDAACQTIITSGGPALVGGSGAWAQFSSRMVAVAGSRSADVRLDATKLFPDPPTTVWYDNILFRPES
jgi:hypothetical protein